MFGLAAMRGVREAVATFAAGFDAALVSATDAKAIMAEAAAAENMLATVKALAARRVAETELWRREGDASAAHHLARTTGTSVGRAREALELAGRLPSLPQLDAAARAGEVSAAQAAPIAEAASLAPQAEGRLLGEAKRGSLGELLESCARTRAAARRDGEERRAAIHASRYLRRRSCADGAGELHYRSTPEEVAAIYSVVRGHAEQAFAVARAQGRREPAEAYLADGLLAAVAAGAGAGGARPGAPAPIPITGPPASGAAPQDARAGAPRLPLGAHEDAAPAPPADGAAPPTPAKVVVRIDWDALVRGWPIDDEVCEITGIGPVAVSVVRAMIDSGDAFLAAVVTRGHDVVQVAHLGRRPSARQSSALHWRSPGCSVAGCNVSVRLEHDHRVPWATTKVTLLDTLDPLCAHHHDLKSYKGFALMEGRGKRAMVAPDDPSHPRHNKAPPGMREPA